MAVLRWTSVVNSDSLSITIACSDGAISHYLYFHANQTAWATDTQSVSVCRTVQIIIRVLNQVASRTVYRYLLQSSTSTCLNTNRATIHHLLHYNNYCLQKMANEKVMIPQQQLFGQLIITFLLLHCCRPTTIQSTKPENP